MDHSFLLVGSGFIAGAMNAMAGGGTFVALAALIGAGVPSVSANASSTVALFPAGVASAWVYRKGIDTVGGLPVRPVFIATLIGGCIGAILLLSTPDAAFDRVLPWLLLVATFTLAFGRRLGPWLRARFHAGPRVIIGLQVVLGIYGGYFGGAVGIMMMAVWCLLGTPDLKTLNAPRTLLVSAANVVAVLCFALAGAVYWLDALLVGVGAIAGGYGGAHVGRLLPPPLVRILTLGLTVAMTAAFFVRGYGGR